MHEFGSEVIKGLQIPSFLFWWKLCHVARTNKELMEISTDEGLRLPAENQTGTGASCQKPSE